MCVCFLYYYYVTLFELYFGSMGVWFYCFIVYVSAFKKNTIVIPVIKIGEKKKK